jgi:hypothetical protein
VPEICRFYGIVIKMFWDDHEPPHFHAEYAGDSAVMDIATLAVINGHLPGRALGLVVEWATDHRDELLALWADARECQPLKKLDPLR